MPRASPLLPWYAPNIAIGNAFGACVFNLVVLVVLDYLLPDESIYRKAKQVHILSVCYFIVLAGFVSVSIEMSGHKIIPSFYHVGLYSPFIIVIYTVTITLVGLVTIALSVYVITWSHHLYRWVEPFVGYFEKTHAF